MSDWFADGGTGHQAHVPDVLGASSLDALVRVVAAGALVSMGLSRDGGSLGVTVTLDGRWKREWFRQGDELADWLVHAEAAVLEANGAVTASSGTGSRPRGQENGSGGRRRR